MSANEDLVDLLGHIIRTTIPCPVMLVRALVPRARNLQFSGPFKVPEKEAIAAADTSSIKTKQLHHPEHGEYLAEGRCPSHMRVWCKTSSTFLQKIVGAYTAI